MSDSDPMDCSPPGFSVHGDSPGKNIKNGLPCPPPGDFPNLGITPTSPALQVDSLPTEPPGKPKNTNVGSLSLPQVIFPTQGLNPRLLHLLPWQVDSLLLSHREALILHESPNAVLCAFQFLCLF